MRNISILICIILSILISACSAPPQDTGISPNTTVPSITEVSASTDKVPEDNNDNQSKQCDENYALFICEDRADIEGDRNVLYCYNYKGDLMKSDDGINIGLFAANSLAPAYDSLTGLTGFVDQQGVFTIEPQYQNAFAFSNNGLALVEVEGEPEFARKYGYINENGEQVIPCIYDTATSFYPTGLAIVGVKNTDDDTKLGVIDAKGTLIVDTNNDMIDHIVGDYILCYSNTEYHIYNHSGELLFTSKDDVDSYRYFTHDGFIYRCNYRNCDRDMLIALWQYMWSSYSPSYLFPFLETEKFNGVNFDLNHDENTPQLCTKRVATTSTGYGCGVQLNQEIVIDCVYDRIFMYGEFYIGIKFVNGNEENQTIDIYNKGFEKTAENLPYCFNWQRIAPVGQSIIMPSNYFDVYIYDKDTQQNLHGIIDHTGKEIVPFLYYRPIQLNTYEGMGGYFIINTLSYPW